MAVARASCCRANSWTSATLEVLVVEDLQSMASIPARHAAALAAAALVSWTPLQHAGHAISRDGVSPRPPSRRNGVSDGAAVRVRVLAQSPLRRSDQPQDPNRQRPAHHVRGAMRCRADRRQSQSVVGPRVCARLEKGPDSMLIGHSVRFCDFCRHEPATSQLEDTAVGSECGHDTTDE